MNRLFMFLALVSGVCNSYAQELKTITVKTSQSIEEYEVLKQNKKIKNGSYIKKSFYGDRIIAKGQYKDNSETGIWEFYDYRTGDLEQEFDFDKRQFLFLNQENTEQNHFNYHGEWIMNKLDTVPVILGGLSNFRLKLLEAAIKFSNEARAYSTSNLPEFPKAGFALFSFIVTKEGETKEYKILQSSGNSFEDKLLKFIEKSEQFWRPGVFRGENVDTEFLIPMSIRYSIDTPEEKRYSIDFNYPRQE